MLFFLYCSDSLHIQHCLCVYEHTLVSGIISAFFGSLSNTVFVIGALYLLYHTETTSAMNNLGYLAGLGILMPNALLEAAAATIITAAFLTGIFAVSKKKSKLSEEQDK